MRPTNKLLMPLVRVIKAVSLTSSNGVINFFTSSPTRSVVSVIDQNAVPTRTRLLRITEIEIRTLFNFRGLCNYECMRVRRRQKSKVRQFVPVGLGYGLGLRVEPELFVNVTEVENEPV